MNLFSSCRNKKEKQKYDKNNAVKQKNDKFLIDLIMAMKNSRVYQSASVEERQAVKKMII